MYTFFINLIFMLLTNMLSVYVNIVKPIIINSGIGYRPIYQNTQTNMIPTLLCFLWNCRWNLKSLKDATKQRQCGHSNKHWSDSFFSFNPSSCHIIWFSSWALLHAYNGTMVEQNKINIIYKCYSLLLIPSHTYVLDWEKRYLPIDSLLNRSYIFTIQT